MIVTLWSQTKEHAINVLVFGVAWVLFFFRHGDQSGRNLAH